MVWQHNHLDDVRTSWLSLSCSVELQNEAEAADGQLCSIQ